MYCPVCNHHDTSVIDSRLNQDGTAIRRRRECGACGYRFSTLEETELLDITVVKRDGGREAYSREKMARGVKKALEKRSYTESDFRSLIHEIERNIQRRKSSELRSADIGEIVMNELRKFDKVAYIRFASVYRSFEDAETFQQELNVLLRANPKKRSQEHKRKK